MKLSDLTPEQWYGRLTARASQQRENAITWWKYINLQQDLVYVARIIAEQDGRFPPLLLPWAELVIESVTERLRLESFLSGERPVDELVKSWNDNDLAVASDEAHKASSVSGLHFLMIGPEGPGGSPMVTTEYCDQVAVELDPRTRQPLVGFKQWSEDFGGTPEDHAVLFIPEVPTVTDRGPGRCRVFELNDKRELEESEPLGEWSRVIAADLSLPSVPFVPMLTNPVRGMGVSDLVQLKPTLDGANQIATNMMAAVEHHAVGRKWIVGATEGDFVDENGKQIPLWKVAMGDVWGIPHPKQEQRGESTPETKVGQFAASDLRNFHESLKTLAQVAASKYGLPPLYMGYSSDNPASAEAIQFSLERLVLRAEKRQLWYGGAWERAGRIQWAILGNDPAEISGMESKWRNAATPTMASKMDAAVKAVGGPVIDQEQAWNDIGYSEATKQAMRERMSRVGAQAAANLRDIDQIPATLPPLPEVNGVAPALRS
ncbi:MAG: phage portal protein [Actinophytocola sp.]|uniref:phage portal protein n=1 Tax=Actinophytocola sp. TaxID=1872138 RepID=UPI003C77AFE4